MTDGYVEGAHYTERTLRPTHCRSMRASSIDTSGVEKVTLLEISGTLEGRPYKLAIEFACDDAARIGQSFIDLAAGA